MTQLKHEAQDQADANRRTQGAVSSAKRWIKRLRVVFALFALTLSVYAALSYRVYTLPGNYDPAIKRAQSPVNGVEPGDTLLLQNFNLWREPKVGDVVIYRHPSPAADTPELLIGRVAGLPGETVKSAGPTMAVGGRDPLSVGFSIGLGLAVKDGDVIPDGRYLVLSDNDMVPYPDGRNLGYVAGDDILRRVVANITSWSGRRPQAP